MWLFLVYPLCPFTRDSVDTQEQLMLAIATQHITVLEADYNPLHYFDSLGAYSTCSRKREKTVSADTCFLQQHKLAPRLLQQSQRYSDPISVSCCWVRDSISA